MSSIKANSVNYIPDLDTLIAGVDNPKQIRSEILPSLLTTFSFVDDSELEDKILEVIFICFM